MNILKEGMLFCYLLAIFFGIAGLTISILAGRKKPNEMNRALKFFLTGMLIMSLYDLLIYYTGYKIGPMVNELVLRLGSCFIAVLFYLWLNLAQKITKGEEFAPFNKSAQLYMIAYALIWSVSTVIFSISYFYTLRWLLMVTDIVLLLFVLVGSIIYLSKAVQNHLDKGVFYYMMTVTAMLVWNYASYFWGEASVYWGNSKFIREPLDLTIIFWFVVNITTLIFIYKWDFQQAYANEEAEPQVVKAFDIERRMELLAEEYQLTSRETDLSRLIYEGKSNSEIAQMLFISESTVKTHVYNIFRKLGVKNRMGVTCIIREEDQQPFTTETVNKRKDAST